MPNMLKVLVAVVVLLIIIGIAMLGKKLLRVYVFRSARVESGESFWVELCAGLLVIVIAIADYLNNRPDNWISGIGVLVFFAGGVLQILARRQLCDDFSFEDRLSSGFEAAQTGMYARVRYPGACALLLLVIGFCVALGSVWGVILAVFLFIPSVLFKISQEERALRDKFGDRWLSYASDSKRLIPGVF